MRNPQGSQGCTVTTLHDHRPGLTSQSQKATAFADWQDRSVGQSSGGQPRLKSLSNMCDGSPSRVSSKTLAQESKPDVAGVLDDPSAGLAGARGLRSSKVPYRGSAPRNVREHGSRERRNGTGEHQHGHNRSQNIQTQTIQAAMVHNSNMMYPIEQNYVASPAPQICDLLQFLEKATPQLQVPPGTPFQDLTLADVWSTMRDASLFGLDVPTCGSVLGRSSAYFVPLLSAMKLFTRGHNRTRRKEDETPPSRGSSRSSKCRYRGSEASWPAEMDLLASHHAQHLPWDRQPLYHELQAMANQAPSDLVPDPQQLLHTPLHLIHPSSWICVWWQPLYRIPDMPLDAKFLVYYSFEAVWNPPPPEHHTPFQLHITGLLTGGVEVHSSDGGASSGERWLRVPRGGDEDADTVHQHTMFEGKLQELLAHLHTRAQQLTCNCDHAVEIVAKDGSLHDDEGHKDFNFLQRGRLGFSNGVME